MAELLDESRQLESTTVGVFRTAATIKGGRRFSFSSLVVVGDRHGQVGVGYGKANEVPPAIEKAQKVARKEMNRVALHGGTLPHEVVGRFGATKVKLMPASPGTGVVAGAAVRAVLEMVGVTDCLTKVYGSTNKQNVVKATMDGLRRLTTKETTASLRGVEIARTEVDEMIERGKAFLPSAKSDQTAEKAAEKGADQGAGKAEGDKSAASAADEKSKQGGAEPEDKPETKPEAGKDEPSKKEGSGESA